MGEVARIEERRKASLMPKSETISFEDFFDAEKDRLLQVMSVITGSRAEAEDITQEAFTRLFERWETVATMDNPAGYLHRAAMNQFRLTNRESSAPGVSANEAPRPSNEGRR